MNNPNHKVLTLSTHQIEDGESGFVAVPTIPGGELYSVGKFIVVYGRAVNKVHPPLAFCRELGVGQYLVIAEQQLIDELDPSNLGETVEEMGEDWPMWRIDGDEPDDEGGWRNIQGKLIRFTGKAPDMSQASENAPVDLPGNIRAKKAWPSLDGTICGFDFLVVVEPYEKQKKGG